MPETNRIVFLGGDLRQSFMAKKLVTKGYLIATYGLSIEGQYDLIYRASSLKSAMNFGNIIVCPIPVSHDGVMITSTTQLEDLSVTSLIANLNSSHILLGGIISDRLKSACEAKKVDYCDLFKEETVSIKNAVATAEGTIAEMITKSTRNLHQSQTIILGFGRCAKILADKLKGMQVNVTICARNPVDLAYADALGFHTLPLKELVRGIHKFHYIVNTVPYMVLTESVVKHITKDALLIDIASRPGGTDFNACEQYGIKAYLSLGLPGKYAPETSADILNSVLIEYITKKEVAI